MRQILHISDVHFGPPHRPRVSDGVIELIEDRRPDFVAISGDLTQRAKPVQFQQARAFVDRIEVPSVTVPGNHDVPMYRVWERLLSPLGAYRKHFAAELEPSFEDDEMIIVGINTAFNWTIKGGRFTRASLERLERAFAGADESKTKVVIAHHELIPAPRFDSQRVAWNAQGAADVLARAGVEMVLSGHLHQSWIGNTEAYYPSDRRPVLLAFSGTSTSSRGRGCERRRNTCNWIQLRDDEIEISHLLWSDSAERFEERSRHLFPRRSREAYRLETF
ncbi:MAG: metallophosphoesterase family protein [Acidobacteriota bacterium]